VGVFWVWGHCFSLYYSTKPHKTVQTVRRFPAALALVAFALTAMLYQWSLPKVLLITSSIITTKVRFTSRLVIARRNEAG
jgi:hypothetical protein